MRFKHIKSAPEREERNKTGSIAMRLLQWEFGQKDLLDYLEWAYGNMVRNNEICGSLPPSPQQVKARRRNAPGLLMSQPIESLLSYGLGRQKTVRRPWSAGFYVDCKGPRGERAGACKGAQRLRKFRSTLLNPGKLERYELFFGEAQRVSLLYFGIILLALYVSLSTCAKEEPLWCSHLVQLPLPDSK